MNDIFELKPVKKRTVFILHDFSQRNKKKSTLGNFLIGLQLPQLFEHFHMFSPNLLINIMLIKKNLTDI